MLDLDAARVSKSLNRSMAVTWYPAAAAMVAQGLTQAPRIRISLEDNTISFDWDVIGLLTQSGHI